MDWRDKEVLVTGAGGFIGSHLTERLVRLGSNVRAFVRYNSRNDQGMLQVLPKHIQEKIEVIVGDLRNPEAVREAVRGVQVVFNLAASVSIPYSYENPREVIETNLMGTLNVLNAVKEYGIEKMVQTSSSEVYGTARYSPIDEDHPLQAQSPYSASKVAADKLTESFHLSFDLPLATIRPFNTYGPRQSARAIIPTVITQALSRNQIFLGAAYPTRDFVYMDDTVNGFIKMAESPDTIGQVVNIGTGFEISIGDLADKIISLIGKEVEVVFDAERLRPQSSEVGRLIADNSKARELIGWEPKVSLDEGLKKTIEWISGSLGRYKVGIYTV